MSQSLHNNHRFAAAGLPLRPIEEPEWYKDACTRYARAIAEEATAEAHRLQAEVHEINDTLTHLGISPITPAHLTDIGAHQVPALLLQADPGRKLRSVWAGHDGTRVVLLVGVAEERGPLYAGPLTDAKDVPAARLNGPVFTTKPLDARALAEQILRDGLPQHEEVDADTYHQLRASHGVIAALLAIAAPAA